MASTMPGTVEAQRRKVGDTNKNGFAIRCWRCPRVDWKLAVDQGHALRAFRASGWLLGRAGAHTDVCPACRNPTAKDKPKAQRVAAYHAIERKLSGTPITTGQLHKRGLSTSSSMDSHGLGTLSAALAKPKPLNPVMQEKLTEAIVAAEQPKEIYTDRHTYRGNDGGLYSVFTTGFTRRDNAARAAKNWFAKIGQPDAKEGTDFVVSAVANSRYAWHPPNYRPAPEVEQETKARETRTPPTKPAKPAPVAKEPTPMPPTLAVANSPAPQPSDPTERKPSREQRRLILDELDRLYNMDAQRYVTDWSDAKLSDSLSLPRVWITTLRVDLYGDHDRNEASAAQARKLDEAVAMADAAYDRLLEMAQEADEIRARLKAARQRLG